jgi:hypothetical protein
LLTAVLLAAGAARGQEAAEKPAKVEETIFRVYEIGDLLRPPRDYPIGGKSDPASPAAPPAAQAVPAEAIRDLLMESVNSDTWKEAGGAIGMARVAPSGTALLVQQTADGHTGIAAVLAELRKQRGMNTMISSRFYWLLLEPKDVDALYAAAPQNPAEWRAMPVVDDALLARAGRYCQAQATCFNGQTVGIQTARDWAAVTDLTPIVGTGAVGYDPTISIASSGVALQLTPQFIPSDNKDPSVVLDLHSSVTETRMPAKKQIRVSATSQPAGRLDSPMNESDAHALGMVERPDTVRQSFATTVRVPVGKRVLVAGMTLQSADGEQKPRNLYLVVQVDAVR